MYSFNVTQDKGGPPIIGNTDSAFFAVIGILVFFFVLITFIFSGLLFLRKRGNDLEEQIEHMNHNYGNTTKLSFESFKIYKSLRKKQKTITKTGREKSLLCVRYKGVDTDILNNKYCIVSFDEKTMENHTTMINKCFSGRTRDKSLGKESFLVKARCDVYEIPKCKIIIVFVDSNDQDEILETLGQEEDLRFLTVKCCQVINADVFVVYCGDSASENLMPGLLYNPQISCITEHPDLKDMEKKDRVFTCYKELTITQREKLAEIIA